MLPLIVNGHKIKVHLADFLITHNDGSLEYLEVKGAETRDWKLTYKLVQALYPDIRYTVVR